MLETLQIDLLCEHLSLSLPDSPLISQLISLSTVQHILSQEPSLIPFYWVDWERDSQFMDSDALWWSPILYIGKNIPLYSSTNRGCLAATAHVRADHGTYLRPKVLAGGDTGLPSEGYRKLSAVPFTAREGGKASQKASRGRSARKKGRR